MRLHKTKNIFSALLPFFFFGLVSISVVSSAKGEAGPTVKDHAPEALQKKARIPTAPREIEQIFIPSGRVILGSDAKEKAYAYTIGGEGAKRWRWFDGEKRRRVFVGDFYIDKYPVTEAQYFEFVRATGHRAPFISALDYQRQGFLVHPYKEVLPYLWHRGKDERIEPPANKLDDPVVLASVADATAYCQWRGSFDHSKKFSLPSEDQWEKAARGTDGRYFPWGNLWDNRRANIGSSGPQGTSPVDRYASGQSPYGVFEMAGNIFEWTRTPAGANSNRNILKSCSWDDMPGICRGAARHSRLKNSTHILIGFRCVSDVK